MLQKTELLLRKNSSQHKEIIERSSIVENTEKIDIYFLIISTLLLSFVLWKKKTLDLKIGLFFLIIYILYLNLIYF